MSFLKMTIINDQVFKMKAHWESYGLSHARNKVSFLYPHMQSLCFLMKKLIVLISLNKVELNMFLDNGSVVLSREQWSQISKELTEQRNAIYEAYHTLVALSDMTLSNECIDETGIFEILKPHIGDRKS